VEKERDKEGQSRRFAFLTQPPSFPLHPSTHTVSAHRTLLPWAGTSPSLAPSSFVAPSASLIGSVSLGDRASVWYGAVLRGDVGAISVGPDSNIQDNAVVHVARHNPSGTVAGTSIGARATIGHGAVVHAASVGDGAFVGMGAVVLDGAVVQPGAIVAAGALVPPGAVIPGGEVWGGRPARKLRAAAPGEADFVAAAAARYAGLAAAHAAEAAASPAERAAAEARRADARERGADYDSHLGVARDPVSREVLPSPGTHLPA
jgi:gamma-carbonic anhydrase